MSDSVLGNSVEVILILQKTINANISDLTTSEMPLTVVVEVSVRGTVKSNATIELLDALRVDGCDMRCCHVLFKKVDAIFLVQLIDNCEIK